MTVNVDELDRTWELRVDVAKYRPEDIDVYVERRRVGRGPRSFLRRRASATCHRVHEGAAPVDVVTTHHNLLLNAGITRLLNLLTAQGATQAYDATHSRIGVGDDATAAVATQTDLQAAAGSAHRQFKLVSSGPTVSGQTVTWVATFAAAEAVFHWQEFGLDVGTADGTTVVAPMLNRKVADNGTKSNGPVWVITMTLTIS